MSLIVDGSALEGKGGNVLAKGAVVGPLQIYGYRVTVHFFVTMTTTSSPATDAPPYSALRLPVSLNTRT